MLLLTTDKIKMLICRLSMTIYLNIPDQWINCIILGVDTLGMDLHLIFLLYIYDMTFLVTHNAFPIVNKNLTSYWLYGAIMCLPSFFGTKICLILNSLAWKLGVFCLALPHSFSLLSFPLFLFFVN